MSTDEKSSGKRIASLADLFNTARQDRIDAEKWLALAKKRGFTPEGFWRPKVLLGHGHAEIMSWKLGQAVEPILARLSPFIFEEGLAALKKAEAAALAALQAELGKLAGEGGAS